MTFTTPLFFLLFLPVALLGYELLGIFGRRPAILFLVMMSCVFYAVESSVSAALGWLGRCKLLLFDRY